MEKIPFQVSAKTARLIGRENISDLDGAINELVKNGYDADAECVIVKFEIPYVDILEELNYEQVEDIFGQDKDLFNSTYEIKEDKILLKEDLSKEILDKLKCHYASFGKIIIIDNGNGMTNDILKTSWMNIGTSDKENNYLSPIKKRIKTGAKGIGRFALDKLSLYSKVYTKNEKDNLYKWELDWSQFDNQFLLKDVNATIENVDDLYVSKVQEVLKDDFDVVKEYNWDSGTMIILEPLREQWNEKLFVKTNNTFNNVNPFNSVDIFDVFVLNKYYPNYNFNTKKQDIKDFDYCIEARYDGNDDLHIILHRNEIDNKRKKVKVEYLVSHYEEYELSEFWNRPAFIEENYTRDSYNKTYDKHYKLKELQIKDINACKTVGPFSLKFYYLKNSKSSVEITKDYALRKRRELLKKFSGIYLYRDNYKVRPYGEEGRFFDWLDLSGRVQRSPAAASHDKGVWRVSPNQLIGSVSISRVDNPLLVDSANREGLMLNSSYDAFIKMIQFVISKFEFDRQYPLRKYAAWIKEKEKSYLDELQKIYEESKQNVKNHNQENEDSKEENLSVETIPHNSSTQSQNDGNYSKYDYDKAIVFLTEKNKKEINIQQLLMILSGSGVLAQTFAHEISRIGTDLGSRGQHLRVIVDKLLDYKEYDGDEDYNPYYLLDELDATDLLLSDWVNLMMDSLEVDKYNKGNINLIDFLNKTIIKWQSLLIKKHITVNFNYKKELKINLTMPEVDLHLLVNNFFINSAYYLEYGLEEKIINIDLFIEEQYYCLDLYNNGPKLDDKYVDNPNIIFEPQISSKEDGTGIGLWIAHEAVIRNYGTLMYVETEKGFKIRAKWLKEEEHV